MSSSYLQFQSESDDQSESDNQIEADQHREQQIHFEVGSYCYGDNNSFCVITNINIKSEECVIFDLFRKKSNMVTLESLRPITKTQDLKKARKIYEKLKNNKDKKGKKQSSGFVELTSKKKRDDSFREYTGIAQEKCCGQNCCTYGTYCICFVLFLIFVGLSSWFLNYGIPRLENGNKFQDTLIKSQCLLINYTISQCDYDCYKCDDTARCDHCNGPWCSKCKGAYYKYHATATKLCGNNIKLQSKLNYNDCPVAGHDLLNIGQSYDCYVSVTNNNECIYNDKAIFVFTDNDKIISIGAKFVDIGYIGISLSVLCLSVIIIVCCKKCIKNLPCMN